jgi:hypothetical protein
MTERERLDRLPRVTDRDELGKASTWEEADALLKKRVDRGDFVVRGMTKAEFDALPAEKQVEILLENRIELLTPEARRRLVR